MSLNDTPRADRLHLGLFGRRNSGKSSLLNALTGQEIAIVSDVAGTTTDPVYKAMELHAVGPVVFIDTAGFDDDSELGEQRVNLTAKAADKTDIALVLFSDENFAEELSWVERFKAAKTPVLPLISRADEREDGGAALAERLRAKGLEPLCVSARRPQDMEKVRAALLALLPEDYATRSITGGLAKDGDVVLLVMPQDIQAPKGRLILPQVQTIRDLLDKKCLVLSVTTDKMAQALAALKEPPQLIITDSQVFPQVWEMKPAASRLTSFSALFAHHKGDSAYFAESVRRLPQLGPEANILIAEACTHNTLDGDIGRIKIPNLLRKRLGDKIKITVVAGADYPEDLSGYDFVIHCGACMFNRRHVLARTAKAKLAGVPMTNYGIFLAYCAGILDKIELPQD